jgi:ABC-type sulfate transport system permease subunit
MLLIARHVGYLMHVTLHNIDYSLLSNLLFARALHLISFVSVVSDISNMLTTSTLYVHLGP